MHFNDNDQCVADFEIQSKLNSERTLSYGQLPARVTETSAAEGELRPITTFSIFFIHNNLSEWVVCSLPQFYFPSLLNKNWHFDCQISTDFQNVYVYS